MDSERDHSDPFLTTVLEKLFNTEGHYHPMRPLDEMPKEFSFDDRTTDLRQFHKEITLTPLLESSTRTSIYKRPVPVRPPHETPLQNKPTIGPATTIHVVNTSGLEKCLWVALGGIGVLILMAFFMKLGKPIRRVRRHLSNTQTSPENPDGNLEMGSHARLVDMNEPGPGYNDPPPPYIECISTNQCDSEEPPPRYSASFEDYKNAEPPVQMRQKHNAQNALSENGVRVELIAKKDDIVRGKRTELLFDNGRIVERQLSLSTILHIAS